MECVRDTLYKYYKEYSIKMLIENCNTIDPIDHTSCIIASPSAHNPNYRFDWIRDSSLFVGMLIDLVQNNILECTAIEPIIENYILKNLHYQELALGGYCVKKSNCEFALTIGEPKFNTDSTVYDLPWGRPQNDGPALRAISMIKYGQLLLNRGCDLINSDNPINRLIYNKSWPINHSVVKRDLEYIASVWTDRCFDLWEEINGHHFYTLCVQHKALVMGAESALQFDDPFAARYYLETAEKIDHMIHSNFLRDHHIISSINICNRPYVERYMDSSVLLAYIHTDKKYDHYLANTVADMAIMFFDEYPVNKQYDLMLIGRYQGDEYFGGNPWVLTTAALAYFLFTINLNNIDCTKLSEKFYKVFGRSDDEFHQKARHLLDMLVRIEMMNSETVLSFAEQIDKNNFHYLSADRLTWNFVELLRSIMVLKN